MRAPQERGYLFFGMPHSVLSSSFLFYFFAFPGEAFVAGYPTARVPAYVTFFLFILFFSFHVNLSGCNRAFKNVFPPNLPPTNRVLSRVGPDNGVSSKRRHPRMTCRNKARCRFVFSLVLHGAEGAVGRTRALYFVGTRHPWTVAPLLGL